MQSDASLVFLVLPFSFSRPLCCVIGPFGILAHVVCECLMECVILETVVVICCQRRLGLMLRSGWDGFYDTGVSGIGQSRSFHGL